MKRTCLSVFTFWSVATLLSAAALPRPEFGEWPAGQSPKEVGKRIADHFLATPHLDWGPENHFTVYTEVCTWYGALSFAKLTEDKALTNRLVERFEPFFTPAESWRIPPALHVDASVFGALPLEIYMQTKRLPYRAVGLQMADAQWDNPTPEGMTNQTRLWIDDMFMITAVQVQAYRATGDTKYLDRTSKEMVYYLEKLQQPNGLFFHAPDVPFFWGRGNGWMAAGMAELLRSLPENHPQRARILKGFRTMMASLLKYQAPDGMWRQLIDQPDAWPETSCTGMFAFAFVTGVKNGWLDGDAYAPAARKAWLQLITYIDEHDDMREVCVGTNKKADKEYYLKRPRVTGDLHGQAPVLWTASALLR